MNNLRTCSKLILLVWFFLVAAATAWVQTNPHDPNWKFPWDECVSMDQIVGEKCDYRYYICDFGDVWFTREVLCNNCIGDCPPGRVFNNVTENCVWPNTIGCGCVELGQIMGTKCDDKYFRCKIVNDDWATDEFLCPFDTLYDPETTTCQIPSDIGC